MAKRKRIKVKPVLNLVKFILIITLIIVIKKTYFDANETVNMYVASNTNYVDLYDLEGNKTSKVYRGIKVEYYSKYDVSDEIGNYSKIKYDNEKYLINKDSLVSTLEETLLEKEMYQRTSYNLIKNIDSTSLGTLIKKGEKLDIIGFDKYDEYGNVNYYKVKYDNNEGYMYSKYVLSTYDEAIKNYDEDGLYKNHVNKKNILGGGSATTLDYYPVEKGNFSDNKMPDNVYSWYLDSSSAHYKNIDSYIELAKQSKINAFVIDIMDDSAITYPSEVMKKYSPSSYNNAINSQDLIKSCIQKLKDNGFYVIGRITTFKDTYYAKDNPSETIMSNGSILKHQSAYWPSAYSRNVWEYKVELAIDAVKTMGFNEIQFDYCRFPDGLGVYSNLDFHNTYNETKAEAIQRFLLYATNELHKYNVYVSADVFGECSGLSGESYVTAYGQYWPAISNVVDVICAMPYLDHFTNYYDYTTKYAGHSSPWKYPYETINYWAKLAAKQQTTIPTPAKARTWITAYNTPVWAKSENRVTADSTYIEKQIQGLYDAGLTGGYMTWISWGYNDRINKYKMQLDAYSKEYTKSE